MLHTWPMNTKKNMIFYGLILFISFLVAWIFKGREDPALSTIPGPQPLPFLGNAMMFFGPSEYVWLKTLKDLRNEFENSTAEEQLRYFYLELKGLRKCYPVLHTLEKVTIIDSLGHG